MNGGDTNSAHERLRSSLPELAAGVLDGRERAELLDHVDACAGCSLELEELTLVADRLVDLAPEADPPLGFETRVVEHMQGQPMQHEPVEHEPRLHEHGRERRSRWRPSRIDRRPLLAVAAAAVVAVGIGWGIHAGTGPGPRTTATPGSAERPAEAALVAQGRTVGVVAVYAGGKGSGTESEYGPSWMSMSVGASSWTGRVWCKVVSADGTERTVGSFSLAEGYGSWIAPLPVPAASVREATMVDQAGKVLATAAFDRPATAT